MTRTDYKIIFRALGFLAVVLNNVPREKQAQRAATLAQLIEAFCAASMPEVADSTLLETSPRDVSDILENYMTELRDTGSARLSYSRDILLGMYELLLIQKLRFEQREFFASGHDDVIANRILQLVEERLRREQQS